MNRRIITFLTVGLILVSTGLAWGQSNKSEILNSSKQNAVISQSTTTNNQQAPTIKNDQTQNSTTADSAIKEKIQIVKSIQSIQETQSEQKKETLEPKSSNNTVKVSEEDNVIPPPIPGAMGEAKIIEVPQTTTNVSSGSDILSDDLKFSNNGNFVIGQNTLNDFKNIYGNYYRYTSGLKSYFGNDSGNSYGTFSMCVETDSNQVVKSISFSQFLPNDLVSQFKTSRGIHTGLSVGQMYQSYGKDCVTNVVKNPNNKLANFTYNYKNGSITFYSQYTNNLIDNAVIYSITISLN